MSTPNSLVDRMKLLLSTGDGADVHFLVGQGEEKELLAAHKVILVAASDVFQAMFRFDAQNANVGSVSNPVVVTDVEVGPFKAMLGYTYADDLSGVDGDNAVAVLYAAKKYNIAGLVSASLAFPISKLSDVFLAFEQARVIGEEYFARRCLDYIDQNAFVLFKSKAFFQIDQKLLCEILSRDQLLVKKEISIWNAALRWADAQCRRNGMECSAENRRAMLGPALHKIRFPLIPKEKFLGQIVVSRVLKSDEVLGVLFHGHPNRTLARLYPLQFPTDQRSTNCANKSSQKSLGEFSLNINQFSRFAQADESSRRFSDVVDIWGMSWKISARPTTVYGTTKCLAFFLECDTKKDDLIDEMISGETNSDEMIEACKATKVLKTSGVYCSNSAEQQDDYLFVMTFEELMDPRKDWYDEEYDSMLFFADVFVFEPCKAE